MHSQGPQAPPGDVLGMPRRTFLAGSATVLVSGTAGAVVAGAAVSSPPTRSGTGGTGYDSPGGAATDPPAGSAAIARLDQIPIAGGLVLAEVGVVLTRSASGELQGFSAICPHARCLVSEVSASAITCASCHGSRFDLATGAVLNGPATSGLTPVQVSVDGERVVLVGGG